MQGAADDDGSQPVTTVDGEGATGLDLVEVFCDATDIARKYQQGETEVTIPLNTYIASVGVPFSVQVDILDLNIRTGAGTNYAKTGETTGKGVFTIVEVKAGQGASVGWGRLKSGAGWISLDYATRLA